MVRLLESSRLVLDADPPTLALLRDALPSGRAAWSGKPLGVISVRRDGGALPTLPEINATMVVSGVRTWVDVPVPGLSLIVNGSESVRATVDRGARRAMLRVCGDLAPEDRSDVGVVFGIAVTLLAGHVGHAVVHAAAVVPPPLDGAWLLVGDSESGKSTSAAALVAAGWDYLSDDSVMLSPSAGETVRVEGWRRGFQLEHASVCDDTLGGGAWRPASRLRGLLFPRVHADEPTRLEPISRAEAFALLVRQSPWLLADRGASPQCASLLAHATESSRAKLYLGSDCHRDGARLIEVLAPMMERAT